MTTRLNCLPMWLANAVDAALTLPISPPVLKSCAPCRVMFSGGFPFKKKRVSQSIAVFCCAGLLASFALMTYGVDLSVGAI